METVPCFGCMRPITCLIVVLLPAPFNPIKPTISLGKILKEIPCKTFLCVYPPNKSLICNKGSKTRPSLMLHLYEILSFFPPDANANQSCFFDNICPPLHSYQVEVTFALLCIPFLYTM